MKKSLFSANVTASHKRDGRKSSFLRSLLSLSAVALLFAAWTPRVHAQDASNKNLYQLREARPVIKSVTPNAQGYKLIYTNIAKTAELNRLTFRELLTYEYEAKAAGETNIANAQIKTAGTKALPVKPVPAYLNDYLSEFAWIGTGVGTSKNGIELRPDRLTSIPDQMLGTVVRITSPFMDLSNNNGKFTYKFTVKLAKESSEPARLVVMSYGHELPEDNGGSVVFKDVTVNSTEAKEVTLKFDNGTWNHCLVIYSDNRVPVVFTGSFQVTQTLEKGDKYFRSVYYDDYAGDFPNLISQDDKERLVVTRDQNLEAKKADMRVLDQTLATKAGARLASRVRYCYAALTKDGTSGLWSMYSQPFYWDGKNDVKRSDYVYLGYVAANDAPNYEYFGPGPKSFVEQRSWSGAIRLRSEEFTKLPKGSQIVGVRVCINAVGQPKQKMQTVDYQPLLPMVFISETLKDRDAADYNEAAKNTYLKMKKSVMEDGWNEILFDQPYNITENQKPLYVGYTVFDVGSQFQQFNYGPNTIPGITPAQVADIAFTGSTMYAGTDPLTIAYNKCTAKPEEARPLMILAIVKLPGEAKLKGEAKLDALKTNETYYLNQPLTFNLSFTNTGKVYIDHMTVEASVGDVKKTFEVVKAGVEPNKQVFVDSLSMEIPAVEGKQTLKVKIVNINGEAVESSNELTSSFTVYDKSKVYDRNVLFELFTSEQCQHCPIAEHDFFSVVNKMDHALRSRMFLMFHHIGLGDDFLTTEYSKGLMSWFGVKEGASEYDLFNTGYVIDRSKNPYLSYKLPTSLIAGLPNVYNIPKAVQYEIEQRPALIGIKLSGDVVEGTTTLKLKAEGSVSPLIDKTKPLYITLVGVQDGIAQRKQQGHKPEGFMHRYVLRYVDAAGFQGTALQVKADGTFEQEFTIPLKFVDIDDKIADNQFYSEDVEGDVRESLSNVYFYAFVHDYAALGERYSEQSELMTNFQNKVYNTAGVVCATDLANTSVSLNEYAPVIVVDHMLVMPASARVVSLFTLNGVKINESEYIPSGAYVARVAYEDGRIITQKLVVK